MLLLSTLLIFVASVSAQVNTTLLQEIATALATATNCAACLGTLMPPLQALAFLGDQPWLDTMTEVCILGKVHFVSLKLSTTVLSYSALTTASRSRCLRWSTQ